MVEPGSGILLPLTYHDWPNTPNTPRGLRSQTASQLHRLQIKNMHASSEHLGNRKEDGIGSDHQRGRVYQLRSVTNSTKVAERVACARAISTRWKKFRDVGDFIARPEQRSPGDNVDGGSVRVPVVARSVGRVSGGINDERPGWGDQKTVILRAEEVSER